MIVVKRSGAEQEFNEGKLNRWASYSAKSGGDWATIARKTMARLPEKVKSSDIHQTMINVCLDEEDLSFSRIATRLEIATIRKSMLYNLGLDDRSDFYHIMSALLNKGVWSLEVMPKLFDDRWNDLYKEIYPTKLEYWQVKQWMDKYALKYNGQILETPHIGIMGIAIATHGDDYERVSRLVKALVEGRGNLPTPVLNGCRNGDFDSISCCVISGGDTVDSIGVAEHIAYKMTAKKAGIGIEFTTRSKGAPVKGGRVEHLGKHGIYQTVDRAVKMFTQVSRGGSATVTFNCIDPEIEMLLQLKTQRIPEPDRIDKMDYSFAYNDAFLDAVINDKMWYLFDSTIFHPVHDKFYTATTEEYNEVVMKHVVQGYHNGEMKARDILKLFLQARQETGRIYCINVSRVNEHTPFLDTIRLSNLCQEICLPTKPYVDMYDLYNKETSSYGETAFCSLAAINVAKTELSQYEETADILLRTVDTLISKAPMMTETMRDSILRRRSVGIGITGLHGLFIKRGLEYDSEEAVDLASVYAEAHYYYLLKSSQKLAEELGACDMNALDANWLPIDTAISKETLMDWEPLRGKPRRNSVLVAHMPTESSAVFSDATNGLYPIREKVINKLSRHGKVQYIAPQGDYKVAWDISNNDIANIYSVIQDFTDQAISADYYSDPTKVENGKVSLAQLMKEWVYQARKGIKTMYYTNTNDDNGGGFTHKAEDECTACKL